MRFAHTRLMAGLFVVLAAFVAPAVMAATPAGLVIYPSVIPGTYHLVSYPTGWTYSLETTADADTVSAWYVAHIPGMQLTNHVKNEMGNSYVYDWTNGGRRTLQIQQQVGEHTEVTLSLTK